MQGVYSYVLNPYLTDFRALYYSFTQQQIGIAGKPQSVNDFAAHFNGGRKVNGRIAGAGESSFDRS